MSPITLLVALGVFGIYLYKKWHGSQAKLNYPPGPPRWPLIGSYHYLLWTDFYKPHIAFTKWAEFYDNPIISYGMGDNNVVVTNDYASCKEALTHPSIQGRVPAYPAHVRTYGENNGYFADDGPRWQTMKRQTLRALRDIGFGRRSEPFEIVLEDEMQKLMKILKDTNGKPVNVPQVFFYSMLNLISHITYGYRYSEADRPVLMNMGRETLRLLSNSDSTGRLLALWPWIRHIFPEWSGETELRESSVYFQNYIMKFLDQHRKNCDENSQSFIDFMIRSKERFPDWTDEEIIISIMDLTFPNVAATLVVGFALGYLVNHPEKLRKCQEEIDAIVGRDRLPNLNDRSQLKMVEASIRETMRLTPLTPLGLTHRATEDTELGGYFIPKNSFVIINQHAMNHDSKLFPEPERFIPERFTNGRDETFSFGLGKRVCVGETFARQNMFTILAAVLQNFNLEISTNLDADRFVYGVAAIPNPDFALRFLPR